MCDITDKKLRQNCDKSEQILLSVFKKINKS